MLYQTEQIGNQFFSACATGVVDCDIQIKNNNNPTVQILTVRKESDINNPFLFVLNWLNKIKLHDVTRPRDYAAFLNINISHGEVNFTAATVDNKTILVLSDRPKNNEGCIVC